MENGNTSQEIIYDSIELNKPVEDSIFDKGSLD
jgi:hypothetical protein